MPEFIPDTDSEDELPPSFEERATDDGYVYYINHQSRTTQWTHPRTGKSKRVSGELPINWEKQVEDGTEKTIFFNKITSQITYTDPRLAFAIEELPQSISDVRQRFDSSSTALQVLHGKDLSGKIAVITGSNTGIGFETARAMSLHGAEVIFACRNQESTELALRKISSEKQHIGRKCRFVLLDLSSLRSTKNFVNELKKTLKHIDYLILNAGVFALPHSITEDNVETTFQVCHLSHFYLTTQLVETSTLLNHSSRILIVSSESHRFGNLPIDNLKEEHLSPPYSKYWSMTAYNNVKLCNVLFARQLGKKLQNRGISVFSLHPGNMVSSSLARNWWFYRLIFSIVRPFTKSLQQAAATTVYCATAGELTGFTGLYFNNCFFCEPSKLSQNDLLAENLWNLTNEMCKRILSQYEN